MAFYDIYKRRGCNETLFTLYAAKNHSCSLTEFFEKLEVEENSYYNAFFRVKEDLLELRLIEFKKNRAKERVIRLTPKGVRVVRILKEINQIIET